MLDVASSFYVGVVVVVVVVVVRVGLKAWWKGEMVGTRENCL